MMLSELHRVKESASGKGCGKVNEESASKFMKLPQGLMKTELSDIAKEVAEMDFSDITKELKITGFPIEKNTLARVLHEYLLNTVGEPDVEDISGAAVLKDLYDCHLCVSHIAQMYLKGIILPKNDREFGFKDLVDEEEYLGMVERLLNPKKRIVPKTMAIGAPVLWAKDKGFPADAKVVDVRSEEAFKNGHYEGALNIPLSKIAINPHIVSNDSYDMIIFICDRGVNACIAAEYAMAAGFKRVFFTQYQEK